VTAVTRLTEQLADVHISLAYMKSEIVELRQKLCTAADNTVDANTETVPIVRTNGNGNISDDTVHRNVSSVSLEVHRTLTDINRRKRNVVVCGLPESSCYSNNQGLDDETAFLRLCEEHLSTKPSLSIKGCIRLGKLTDNNLKPRRLLVHLTSEENALCLLSDAKNLRRSDEPYIAQSVYINPDMSPTQAKLAFEKRAKKRAQREAQAKAEAQITKPGSGSAACGAVLATVSESSTITPSEPSDLSAVVSRSSVLSTSSPPASQTLSFTNHEAALAYQRRQRQRQDHDRSASSTASASAPIFHHGSDSRLKSSAAEFVSGADKS